jgi:hypothetical protein
MAWASFVDPFSAAQTKAELNIITIAVKTIPALFIVMPSPFCPSPLYPLSEIKENTEISGIFKNYRMGGGAKANGDERNPMQDRFGLKPTSKPAAEKLRRMPEQELRTASENRKRPGFRK